MKDYSLQDIVNDFPISHLTNTDDDIFWYLDSRINSPRFKHELSKVGNTFYDGNNGDKWKVLAINTDYKRMIVSNLTQKFERLVYWD